MDRRTGGTALPDQRPELRPLQNLRHQGPERQYHLGSTGRRWRTQLRGDVTVIPGRVIVPRGARSDDANPESRSPELPLDSGFAPKRARPGMTVSHDTATVKALS